MYKFIHIYIYNKPNVCRCTNITQIRWKYIYLAAHTRRLIFGSLIGVHGILWVRNSAGIFYFHTSVGIGIKFHGIPKKKYDGILLCSMYGILIPCFSRVVNVSLMRFYLLLLILLKQIFSMRCPFWHMRVHFHANVNVYVCVHRHVNVHVCVTVHVHVHVRIHMSASMSLSISMSTVMSIFMFMYIVHTVQYMKILMYMSMSIFILCTCLYIYMCMFIYIIIMFLFLFLFTFMFMLHQYEYEDDMDMDMYIESRTWTWKWARTRTMIWTCALAWTWWDMDADTEHGQCNQQEWSPPPQSKYCTFFWLISMKYQYFFWNSPRNSAEVETNSGKFRLTQNFQESTLVDTLAPNELSC